MMQDVEYEKLQKSREQRNIILEAERDRLIEANNKLIDSPSMLISTMSEIRENSLVIIKITKLLSEYDNAEM